MNPGYTDKHLEEIKKNAKILNIPIEIFASDIFASVEVIGHKSPCYMCARMRRGHLYNKARELGCNKIALGHHFDDVVKTYLLSLMYEGRISCFKPVTYLDRVGVTLIRPLLYTPEYFIRAFAQRQALPIVHNPCPADGTTKRQEDKDLHKALEKQNRGVRERIFGAIQRYPLDGWAPDTTRYR